MEDETKRYWENKLSESINAQSDELNKMFMKTTPDTTGIEEIEEHEMTDFERELAQAILGALEYRGFYDCGKYLDTSLIEHIRPLIHQELQKAREEERKRCISIIEPYWDEAPVDEVVSKIRYQSELDQNN